MINDRILAKIEIIINYLEDNGNNVYNQQCSNNLNFDVSNIIKYVNEIRKYLDDLKYNKSLETYIKIEICNVIMDNLNLFSFDDSKLILLKKYSKKNINNPITPTPSNLLKSFIHEALLDLIETENLYDFRSIE